MKFILSTLILSTFISLSASAASGFDVSCDVDGGRIFIKTTSPFSVAIQPSVNDNTIMAMKVDQNKVLVGRCAKLCVSINFYPVYNGTRLEADSTIMVEAKLDNKISAALKTPDGVTQNIQCRRN